MPGGTDRLYLAESVAAVVEVKSDLSSQWKEVEHSAGAMAKVRRRWSGSTSFEGSTIALNMGVARMPVPYFAVGYTGYKQLESLRKRLEQTSAEARPAGALVVDSGVFVGPKAFGSDVWGLYAFCVDLIALFKEVTNPSVDIARYVR
jgi:hypothetical protein